MANTSSNRISIIFVLSFVPLIFGCGHTHKRDVCEGNLERIAAALGSYAIEHGEYVPLYTVDDKGNKLHSWRVLLLPHLGHESLYRKIDLSLPWDHPANRAFAEDCPDVYRCEFSKSPKYASCYMAINAENSLWTLKNTTMEANAKALRSISIVEVEGSNLNWMSPDDLLALDGSDDFKAKLSHSHNPHVRCVSGYLDPQFGQCSEAEFVNYARVREFDDVRESK